MTEEKKEPRRISLAVLLTSAIVFGFVAGMGGALLLSHSLIQKPLQEQQEESYRLNLQHQRLISETIKEMRDHQADLDSLKDELEYLIKVDSSNYLSKLSAIQKENTEQEKELITRFTTLEQDLEQLDESHKTICETVNDYRRKLEQSDVSIKDQLRMLQNNYSELENRFNQLQRRVNTP